MSKNPTASVLIIGNEVLSGRTQDANLNFIAKKLASRGILLQEARVIPDIPEVIISTLNEVRAKYTYVFTTGGIGPTHDDITAECVAQAFGVPWVVHEEAKRRLEAYYAERYPEADGPRLNPARLRMATIPDGATLIDNPATVAPGFVIGNVYVLAGIPKVMQAMLGTFIDTLAGGAPVQMRTVVCNVAEGDLADELGKVQKNWPMVDVGSYPVMDPKTGRFITHLVCKGTDAEAIAQAVESIKNFLQAMGAQADELTPQS